MTDSYVLQINQTWQQNMIFLKCKFFFQMST